MIPVIVCVCARYDTQRGRELKGGSTFLLRCPLLPLSIEMMVNTYQRGGPTHVKLSHTQKHDNVNLKANLIFASKPQFNPCIVPLGTSEPLPTLINLPGCTD